jgi:hypothetical protein
MTRDELKKLIAKLPPEPWRLRALVAELEKDRHGSKTPRGLDRDIRREGQEEEREACARVVEAMVHPDGVRECAAAIRARSAPEAKTEAPDADLPLRSGRHDNEAALATGTIYRHRIGPDGGYPEIGVVEVTAARDALARAYSERDTLRAEMDAARARNVSTCAEADAMEAELRAKVEALTKERDEFEKQAAASLDMAADTAEKWANEADELKASLSGALAREAGLRAVCEEQLKRCRCHGSGRVVLPCPFCADSTHDHECADQTRECLGCKAFRAALSTQLPPERTCPECHEGPMDLTCSCCGHGYSRSGKWLSEEARAQVEEALRGSEVRIEYRLRPRGSGGERMAGDIAVLGNVRAALELVRKP